MCSYFAGALSVTRRCRRRGVTWRTLLPTLFRAIIRWAHHGLPWPDLVLTIMRDHFQWPPGALRLRFLLRTLVLPLALAALTNYVVEKQRIQHDPVIIRSAEDVFSNNTLCDAGEFTVRRSDSGYGFSRKASQLLTVEYGVINVCVSRVLSLRKFFSL